MKVSLAMEKKSMHFFSQEAPKTSGKRLYKSIDIAMVGTRRFSENHSIHTDETPIRVKQTSIVVLWRLPAYHESSSKEGSAGLA